MGKRQLIHSKEILLLLLIQLFLITGVHGKSLSLHDYLDEVKKENPNIEASKLRALALKHKIKPSATLEDPFIAAGIDEIPFAGGGGEIRRYQISQSIPFPGKLGAKSEIAERRVETSEFEAKTIISQIEVMATQTFLKTSYNLQAIISIERIQKIIQETIASAKARYKTGDANHHEWLLAKLELSVLHVELLRLKRIHIALTALLNELRNKSADSPIEIDQQNLFHEEEESHQFEPNLDLQPELSLWNSQKKSAETELKLAKLSYAPDFVIQGMAMEPIKADGMSKSSNWGVMVGLSLPLFFWRKQSELVAAAEKDRLATLMGYQSLQNRLNTEITDAKQQLKTSLDVVKLYKNDVIPITEIAVKNSRSAYATKTLPMRQLLDALRSQRTQELEFLAAQMDVVVAKTRIKNLLSNPPVTRFAPPRPTLFGADMSASMGESSAMVVSPTVNMGSGMSGPTRKQSSPISSGESSSGMGGM